MTAITATVHAGRINVAAPPDWPEGSEVLIEPLATDESKIGMDESQWRDDAAALADWDRWLPTIQPLEFTDEELMTHARFREEMKRYNIEAVRRQMEADPSP
jgi:hypothetical protein